jgi:alginate O-acetyltransferase complex protein AlgI
MFDGLFLLSLGLFMKVVLADSLLSATADAVFGANGSLPALDAWAGLLAFSGQIFFDFAGYSTCAVGVALCLGFVLPQNFNYPYAAIGFSDFWRRWHITLSAWLRDYVYIPLGGNRRGRARMYYALMMTMLLGGLWHGANWTFVVWGGLHGLYLWIERLINERWEGSGNKATETGWKYFPYAFLTFMLVNVTWVFFRATTFGKAWDMLQSLFGLASDAKAMLTTLALLKVFVVVTLMVIAHWIMRNRQVLTVAHTLRWHTLGLVWAFLILMVVWAQESSSAFIYFQF